MTAFPGAKTNEPLSRHTTWGIGGPADFFIEVQNRKGLAQLLDWAKERNVPLFPIGQGSNLLVSDKGLRGAVVRLRGEFEEMRFDGPLVEAGAGVMLPPLARAAAERGLSGAEPFVGIPGTVGGALMTNAGTPEGDIGRLVEAVEILDESGEIKRLEKKDVAFSYRHSSLAGAFVLSATLRLTPGVAAEIAARTEAQKTRRAERQPLGTKNCGSVFKNPPDDHAARLIEAAGLKGRVQGGARISPKHANFIENTGGATAEDVRALIDAAKTAVKEKFNVTLELEVWPVGEWP